MKDQVNITSIILLIAAVIFAVLYFTSQSPARIAGMPPPNNIPADTQIILSITKNGKFFPSDKDGNPLQPCNLCSPDFSAKYGAKCEKAPKESNVCGSLRNATVNDFAQINFIKTKVNPDCDTLIIGNKAYPWPPGCGQ